MVVDGPFLGKPTLGSAVHIPNHMAAPSAIARKPLSTAPQHDVAAFPRAPSPELSLPQDCAFPAFPLPFKSPVTRKPVNSRTYMAGNDTNNKSTLSLNTEASSSTNPVVLSRQQSQPDHSLEAQISKETVTSTHAVWNPEHKMQSEHPVSPATYQTTPDMSIYVPTTASAPRRLGLHDRKKSVSAANRPLDEIGSVRTHRSVASRSGSSFIASEYGQPRSASAQGYLHRESIHDRPPPMPGTINGQGHNIVRSASATAARKYSAYDAPPLPNSLHTRSESPNPGHLSSNSTSSNQSETSQPATSSSRSSLPASPPRHTSQEDVGNLHNRTVQGLGIHPNQAIGPPTIKSFSRPTRSQPNSSTSSPDLSQQVSSGAPQSIHKTQVQAHRGLSPDTLEQVPASPRQSLPQGQSPTAGVLSPETLNQVSAGPWQTQSQKQPYSQGASSNMLSPETLDQVSAGPWKSGLRQDFTRVPQDTLTKRAYGVSQNNTGRPLPESMSKLGLKGNALPPLQMSSRTSGISAEYKESARSAVMPSTRNHTVFGSSPSLLNHNSLRRAATVSKGKCRGCSQAITGKSVSSADGRLTGRWHRQCFACKTCSEPFPTMDFYVFGNDPYCGRHYHQLNKSLCSSCDRGIEGQYVENEQQKFHPHCFSCSECHLILRDTYFDLNGKIYCERHASKPNKLALPGPGRRYPEKRFTRLMMI